MRRFMRGIAALLIMLLPVLWAAADDTADTAVESPRDLMINQILEAAHDQYIKTGGKLRRAQYSGDIYICKNFTVYCFKQAAEHFRLAACPDKKLIIPDNLPDDQCKRRGFGYGVCWKDIPLENGNPFYEAASFRYDPNKSRDENRQAAREFLKQVRRGDFFQMRANYYWGVGAHSLIFSADYDPETDSVTWTDSNMRGQKKNGIRYGQVQWDATKAIDWFVDAFCRKKYGATLYRLSEDLVLYGS